MMVTHTCVDLAKGFKSFDINVLPENVLKTSILSIIAISNGTIYRPAKISCCDRPTADAIDFNKSHWGLK